MKNRPTWIARTADRRRRSFAFHPLSFAICLGFSAAALAGPQGGTVVAGQATITQPTPTSQVINQTSGKAIIDWKSFSIATGEKVRFNQPSTTSVTLNRVTGYDPSYILGEMSSNGKIFLVNPYGVVFGAGARVDVGGLVVSSLSLANSDFLAGHYSLTSAEPGAPGQRGEVRNEGTISAPGGTVVLAGPTVSNTGTIVVNGGRVGMVAANSVSVDVEGDGLLFFQTSATEAKNRLQQLGRIQADGGSIEMRAAARGAFADTVLNMTGIVQAKTIGNREGRVVIDGGGEGITSVSGRLDASGLAAGERGGDVTVQGQKVLIDRAALVDVSGGAGGGSIRVGGDLHGANPEVRNAEGTIVMPGAVLRADALTQGDGGKVVVWADGSTAFNGSITARGGALGGDGGSVETSGKHGLSISVGEVNASAAAGRPGTWLLDPDNITVAVGGVATTADVAGFLVNSGTTQTIAPATLVNAGTSVTLQALVDITFTDPVALTAAGAGLTAQAGRSIKVNAGITTNNGAISLRAVDPTSGAADVTGVLNIAAALNSGTAPVTLRTAGTAGIALGAGVTAGQLALTTTNAPVAQSAGVLTIAGTTTVSAGTGAVTLGTATNQLAGAISSAGTGAVTLANGIATQLGTIGASGNAAASLSVTTSNDAVSQTGPAFVAGTTTVAAGTGAVTLNSATNQLTGAVSSSGTGAVTVVNDVATQLGAIGATGVGNAAASLSVTTTNDAVSQTAAAFIAGTTTVAAGSGAVTLDAATNQLGGAVGSAGTGAVTLVNSIATQLGAIGATGAGNAAASLSVTTSNDAVTQSAAAFVAGTTTIAAGTAAVTLNNVGNELAGAISSSGTGAVTLVNSIATQLGAIGATGAGNAAASLNVTTSNDSVTQTADVFVAGATVVNAGTADITLARAGNDFQGTVSLTGGALSVRDANDLDITTLASGSNKSISAIAQGTLTVPAGAINTGTADLDLQSRGGALTTPGPLSAANLTLTGATGLTIANSLTAANVSLNATNAAITETAGGVINATGATTFNAGSGAVTLGQANLLNSVGGTGGTVSISEASAGGVVLAATNATDLTVATTQAGASVTQNAPLNVSGATTITTAGSGAVTLADLGNNLGSFGATAGGAVLVSAGSAIVLDAISAPSLVVDTSAGNGAVTQAAALNITGATTINAGSGAVTLGAANALGSFGATGGAVSLTENSAGGIALDNVNAASLAVNTSAANGNVTQTALRTLTVSGATTVSAGTGAVTLVNTGNNLGSFGATGGAVSVRDSDALALDAISASSLNIDTSAGNGALTQNAAVVVTGATVVNTGTGPIVLSNPGNDFSNLPGNSFSGGAISVRDSNDLTVTTLAAGLNQSISVVAGLGLSLPGSVNTGNGNLTLASGAILTTPGTLNGNNVSLSGTGGVSIGNNVTAAGNLNLTATNNPVTQTGGTIVSGGTTTVTAGTGTVTLAQAGNDFNSINVASGGGVSIHDSNALTAAANASGNLTITSTGALSSGGTLSGANIALTGAAGINLGNNVTTPGTLQLTTTNAAITQTAGAVTVGNLTTATAGSGDITLNQAGNDFSDLAGISVSGGAVRLRDANALIITSLVNGANKDLSLTAGTTITGLAGNIDTGSADLAITSGAGFTSFGTLRGTNVTLGGGTGGVSIGDNVTALGNLTLNATNAPITQTAGTITAAGTTTASAGTGSISLALPGNNFATFAATGSTVAVRDDSGLVLGPITTTALTLDTSAGNGPITQTGAAVVSGTTTITAGTGAVTLTNAGNDFASIGVSGGAVAVTDSNALALNAINASSLTVDTSAGNGNVTQNAAAIVSGATAVNAGSGAVTLNIAGNNFGSVGATGGAIVVGDINALALDATNASSLVVTAGGPISQVGAVMVSGATTVNAGASAITLSNAGNDFASISASGGAVSISDSNALALAAINATSLTLNTAAGNGNITQSAAAIVSGATSANAGSGAVTLNNAGNNFGSVAAVGGAVSVTDFNGLTLGAISATSLNVNTAAGSGAVAQSGPAVVSGASNVNAGGGAVTLDNAGNNFATLGVTGGAISIVDTNALVLSSLVSAPNQAVSVVAGGALTLPATAVDTGSAALTLTSGGTLTSVGTLRGTDVALTSTGAMTLANDLTALGTLALTTTNAPILQTGGSIVAVGTATVSAGSGDITLAQTTNDFQSSLLLSGGAISIRDINNLAVTSLVSGVNKPVSLIAGGSLSLPTSAIDTGTADLTLQALGGTLVINGPLSGSNVTLTGSAGLALGADITSSGDQIYTSTVQLANSVTLNAGGSKIDLQGGADGNGNSLALVSSNAAANAIHTGAAITNTAQFAVTGNSTLGGNVTTTGNQSYSGPVTLGTDVALASGAAKIDLQSSVDAAGHNLALTSSNAAADAIRAAGVISNAAQLTVTGKSTFSTGVTTSGAQLYSDTVTLGSTANFVGSSLGFGNGIVAGTFDLGLRSDALNFAGTVSGSGNASLSPLTQGATIGVAGGAGTYQLSQATLDAFSSFASITVGRADGTGDLSFGNLVLPTSLTVLSNSGDVGFTGTVASAAGQARNLGVTTGGNTTFAGAVGGAIGGTAALGNLSVAGATQLNASTTAKGTVSLAGPVKVGADATVSAAAVSLGSTLDIGTHALALLSDSLTVAGPATGSGAGSVQIAPKDAAGSMGIGGGAGTLQVSQGLINTFAGVPTLSLGRNDSTGTITAGSLTLPTDLAIANGSGAVFFTGSVDSASGPARDLAVTTTGTTSFAGTVGTTRALDTLSVSGSSQLGASIVTTGAQSYAGPASLVADSTLTGPSVSFGSTLDGAHALTVAAAATNFAGAIGATTALTSLTTDTAGTTQLGGNVTTSGGQTYSDALLLNGDAVLTGSTLNLAGSVNGAHTLAVNGSTGVTLGGPIGGTTALAGLSVGGPLQLNAGAVTTTGAQSYAGAATLGAATTLSAPAIAFGSTLDGGFALTTQSAGPTSFTGAVGATTPLASLTAAGGGTVQLSGPSVDTSGAQSYSGALQLTGSSRLTGSALTLTGPVSGATDLTLQANAFTGGSSISGTGVLTIAPLDPTLSIGVAGGAGALQVSQAALDGASGFSGHVIGRADGSGAVSAGNLVLRANTTLQSATGDLNVGSVDGAFALALNSGGTTRIAGPVGAVTPLTSLTTDNNAAAADWNGTTGERTSFDTADGTGAARVITSGAQTYNDPVTASVPVAFRGGAIAATQAANRFDDVVSANAISLDLHNSADLRLGTLTLVNGGTLETDGVLHVTGAVQVNGGVLTLASHATPTPVDLTDPEYAGKTLSFGFVPIREASPGIVQDAGGTISTAAGSMLVLRAPAGGSILLEQPGNTLLGQVSAVTGTLGDNDASRFNNATGVLTLGFLRIVSSEIHVAGRPPSNGDQTLQQAGLEADVIKLTADVLTTGPDGLIRARLPFNNIQGSQSSIPGLTLAMSPTALADGGGFGGPEPDKFIQVQVGGAEGGFLTARPKGVSGDTAVIFLGGDSSVTPFYDGSGKISEIRIFYNGNAPRTPQETGALAAVLALIEDARQARVEEAVRTENVRSRLRSGVIAEVGAGRPATVGRESIRLPDTCEIKPKTLLCE